MFLETIRKAIQFESTAFITLVFAIATLHLLVGSLLDLPLQDASSRRFIKSRSLEDMCCIYPVIGPPPHNTIAVDLELIDRDLSEVRRASQESK